MVNEVETEYGMEPLDYGNKIVKRLIGYVQHYNPEKYWKMRNVVISKSNVGGG
jgi:hypothetical protein